MFALPLLLAAGSLPTLISGAPVPSFLSNLVERVSSPFLQERSFTYLTYGGNGDVSDGWPAQSDWISDFTTMFSDNQDILSTGCGQFGVAENSASEIADISTAIQSVASSTGVDARFILAIVMQESNGCVRAPTTNYGVVNPGLMQSHDGSGSCNDGSVLNPCPASQITQMIQDGTGGTSSGDGLQQLITQTGASDVSKYYKAARMYNSGSIASTGNLGQGVATHCYASDIANRLTGWSAGTSGCSSTAVEALTGTATSDTSSSSGGTFQQEPSATTTSSAAAVTSTAVVVPLPATTTQTPAPVASVASTPASSAPASSASIYPGAVSPCATYYTVLSGDYCDLLTTKTGANLATLQQLNSGLDSTCENLWLGYQYCVQA